MAKDPAKKIVAFNIYPQRNPADFKIGTMIRKISQARGDSSANIGRNALLEGLPILAQKLGVNLED